MKIRVHDGQNIFNIALKYYGSVEGIFDILENNNISMDTLLQSGMELEVNPLKMTNARVVEEYNKIDYVPNTGDDESLAIQGEFSDDFNFDFPI